MPSPLPAPFATALAASPFVDASAVEAWDAWFRWRCEGQLRDLTVEASWERVANALAAAESTARSSWRKRFRQAMADWQLLPDQRLLASAGTCTPSWPGSGLAACLNVVAFVREPCSERARFDRDVFRACAGLAVRMLDDALLLVEHEQPAPRLRIGMIGLSDACELLGLGYAEPAALAFARELAALLAEATLEASVALAAERGGVPFDAGRRALARSRGMPEALLAAADAHGVRHAALTAIDSQPCLALLANNVANALDPQPGNGDWQSIDAPGGSRHMRSAGFAQGLRRRMQAAGVAVTAAAATPVDIPEQIRLRAAIAPWIDAPIDYPYRSSGSIDAGTAAQWTALAERHGLPVPRWRDRTDLDREAPGSSPPASIP